MKLATTTILMVATCTLGCGGSGDRATAEREDRAAVAAAQLTPETFDTVQWAADTAAIARGAVVWTYSCRKCHGEAGRGDGGFVMNGDTVRPPSLLEADWRYANDRQALREQIYTGTNQGMPHWGLEGLKPRDIDAVAVYIQRMLRW
jgi:mono/diheme cytochrome c family protein